MQGLGGSEIQFMFGMFAIVTILFAIIPFWFIFSKAGFKGALSLLMAIPLINILMLFFLAFKKWPIQNKIEDLTAKLSKNSYN